MNYPHLRHHPEASSLGSDPSLENLVCPYPVRVLCSPVRRDFDRFARASDPSCPLTVFATVVAEICVSGAARTLDMPIIARNSVCREPVSIINARLNRQLAFEFQECTEKILLLSTMVFYKTRARFPNRYSRVR